ncbi:MAG: hypothetical protein U1C74_02150 [Phenylobacterium sp.]|nr:hypothetical protein [Phenylobacterium sp.]
MHSPSAFRLYRRDLRFAPGVVLLCALLGGLTLINVYGDRIVKIAAVAFMALGVGLLLTACGSTGTGAKVLENLESCNRRYDGAISAGITGAQFTGTIKVECLNADLERVKLLGLVAPAASTAPEAETDQ